ncbi:hypothetical protein NP493_538g00026 [Ridgeia piscesae]|uniref:Bridge-like lipid transfer protein family member 1 C-terminal domain-containing protein n=1 Tax=Ridgeia piscesae TaxID=27915 RepID=A0AAD9NS43_RIDPI|nr:hypothetical protein NP493_538g00026 [Ridgeia piscesae]
MKLHSNKFRLVCFHGINFRSKMWALFTLYEPMVQFETKVWQYVQESHDEPSTDIVQKLTFQIGHDLDGEELSNKSMATVCKVTRSHHVTPHISTVADWFHYTFSTGEIKKFPDIRYGETGSPSFTVMGVKSDNLVGIIKQQFSHEAEIIFMLPAFMMHQKTLHKQGPNVPTDKEPSPVVDCAFNTEFMDHMYISMDAEIIFFIHDLITSYMQEDGTESEMAMKGDSDQPQLFASPAEMLMLDGRDFHCNSWHLEPTIRLLSLGGKKIDPVGVDYILQKLGFQHARMTIPKWIQRGYMDPLDYFIAGITKQLIKVLEEDKTVSHK